MKKIILILLGISVFVVLFVVVGFQVVKYEQRQTQKRAVVISIPTFNEMSAQEYERQKMLFDGDTLVRVRLYDKDTTIVAVATGLYLMNEKLPKPGEDVYISNWWNGNEYLILY